MSEPVFRSEESASVWEHGRVYGLEQIIERLKAESLDPDYEGEEFKGYRLGLRMALHLAQGLTFPENGQ